jgi:nucleotide-binding universal stress UspA family protein
MSFQKILIAIDNSQLCPAVFKAALELARANQAAVKLVHCLTPEVIGEPTVPRGVEAGLQPELMAPDYQTQEILIERQIEEAQALLKRYAEEARRYELSTETEYKLGEAGSQLCETARTWEADLIVVGRRGRTGLTEALLGSVSNHVIHHAPCSVLVIQDVELEPSDRDDGADASSRSAPASS